MKKHYFIILSIFLIQWAFCQTESSILNFDPTNDDLKKVLPPLETIMDSAVKNNAEIKFWETDISKNDTKIRSQKRYWLKHVRVGGNASYGTYDNYSLDQSTTLPTYVYSKQNQSRYSTSFNITFPLYDMANRRNEIHFTELERDQSLYKLQSVEESIRQDVIRVYSDVLKYYEDVKIYAENYDASELNIKTIEKQFLDGNIDITEYSRQMSIHANNKSLYMGVKAQFIYSLMLLEEIAGFKF